MNVVPLIIIAALFLVLIVVSNRSKAKRTAADAERRRSLTVGTRIMTTSGLHATIAAIDPANDGSPADTVVLHVAPGVELTWALAAVREAPSRTAAELPPTGGAGLGAPSANGTDQAAGGTGAHDGTADPRPLGLDGTPAPDAVRLSKPKGRVADR